MASPTNASADKVDVDETLMESDATEEVDHPSVASAIVPVVVGPEESGGEDSVAGPEGSVIDPGASVPSVTGSGAIVPVQLVECTCCHRMVDKETDAYHLNKNIRQGSKAKPIYRCKICSKVNMVLYREMQTNKDLQAAHKKMSPKDRGEWLRLHNEEFRLATSDMITKSFRQQIRTESDNTTKTSCVANWEVKLKWMDEPDVVIHFKNKPGVADEVLKNAKPYWCPTSKRKLFGVPDYEATATESNSSQQTTSTKTRTDADVPKPKAAKKPRTAVVATTISE